MGDRETIDIWHDKWIPGSADGRIKTRRNSECTIRTTAELMREREWNQEILKRWFIAEDIQKIMAIPISITGCKDRMYWRCTKSGLFTVKSAYAVAMEEHLQQQMTRREENKESTRNAQKISNIWKGV